MADQRHDGKPSQSQDYMRGGKGRTDQVGGSGIYPASSPDAPGKAQVRTEAELVRHNGRPPKVDQSTGSE